MKIKSINLNGEQIPLEKVTLNKFEIFSSFPKFFFSKSLPLSLIKLILSVLPTFLARRVFLAYSDEKSDRMIVYKNPGTYKALEVLYSYPDRRKKDLPWLDAFWHEFLWNAMAVRARKELVKKILIELIELIHNHSHSKVNLASVGCGSGRAVIEAVAALKGKIPINLFLVDLSKEALEYSEKLVKNNGLTNVSFIRGTASNLPPNSMGIIEMVGLIDYFLDQAAIKLLTAARRALAEDGFFLTCNIVSNLERGFVTKVINWKMIYRSPEQLTRLLSESGFIPLRLLLDPWAIHCLAIARPTHETNKIV